MSMPASDDSKILGRIVGIAIREKSGAPMTEIVEASATKDGGIDSDVKKSLARGITFLSVEKWHETMDEMGLELPWPSRRANVLVESVDLLSLIGKTIEFGSVAVLVNGETEPCARMEALAPGLREALAIEGRAGVYGRVVQSGAFRVGDSIRLVDSDGSSDV